MGSQVILATAGYDHTIKLWEATSGICYRTLQYADSQASRSCTPRHAPH
jgi:G protein beta subunit-like protein